MPWAIFLPTAVKDQIRILRTRAVAAARANEAALSLLLWAILVLGFFTLSNRQEYYSLPALPALALIIGSLLARADNSQTIPSNQSASRSALNWHLYTLVPLTTLVAIICGYYAATAPHPAPGADIVSLLTMAGSTEAYNLSLSHVSDLTGAAMGFFRGPLAATAIGMLGIGLGSYLLRRARRTYAANLTLAAFMTVILLAAHEGLARFYPILGSKGLAQAITQAQQSHTPRRRPHPDRRRAHRRLHPDLLHRPTGPSHQRPRKRPLVRKLLARLTTHLRNRRLASTSSGPARAASSSSPTIQKPALATSPLTEPPTSSPQKAARPSSPITKHRGAAPVFPHEARVGRPSLSQRHAASVRRRPAHTFRPATESGCSHSSTAR